MGNSGIPNGLIRTSRGGRSSNVKCQAVHPCVFQTDEQGTTIIIVGQERFTLRSFKWFLGMIVVRGLFARWNNVGYRNCLVVEAGTNIRL